MKKIIAGVCLLLIGLVVGVNCVINTMAIDIEAETDTGIMVTIDALGQSFDYYIER